MTDKEIVEKKLAIVEREITELKSTIMSAEVNLRKQKGLRWELLGILECEVSAD